MYYSNKRLKPITLSEGKKHIWNRYWTNKLSLYRCQFWFFAIFVRTLPGNSASVRRKSVFRHLKRLVRLSTKYVTQNSLPVKLAELKKKESQIYSWRHYFLLIFFIIWLRLTRPIHMKNVLLKMLKGCSFLVVSDKALSLIIQRH